MRWRMNQPARSARDRIANECARTLRGALAFSIMTGLVCCSGARRESSTATPEHTYVSPSTDAGTSDARHDAPQVDPPQARSTSEASPVDAGGERRVTIAATGDLVLSRRLVKAWQSRGEDGFEWMLTGYRSLLVQDEIAYLNLETPLVDDEVPLQVGWPPVLGAPPGVAGVLAETGVDIVSLANNHAYDQGHAGLGRTIALLEESGVQSVGAGPTVDEAFGSVVIEQGHVRVAFLGFTGPMNLQVGARGATPQYVARLWDEERVLEAVEQAQNEADVVIVCAHWSRDFRRNVPRELRRLAHRIVEAGADVILGSGPHILQEVERLESARGDAVVAYSLGNVLSSMAFRHRYGQPTHRGYVHPANVIPEARDGVVLRVSIDFSQEHVGIDQLEATPIWTSINHAEHVSQGVPLEIRVIPLRDAPEAIEQERRPLIESALGDQVELLD